MLNSRHLQTANLLRNIRNTSYLIQQLRSVEDIRNNNNLAVNTNNINRFNNRNINNNMDNTNDSEEDQVDQTDNEDDEDHEDQEDQEDPEDPDSERRKSQSKKKNMRKHLSSVIQHIVSHYNHSLQDIQSKEPIDGHTDLSRLITKYFSQLEDFMMFFEKDGSVERIKAPIQEWSLYYQNYPFPLTKYFLDQSSKHFTIKKIKLPENTECDHDEELPVSDGEEINSDNDISSQSVNVNVDINVDLSSNTLEVNNSLDQISARKK